jgi:hypothetical protein
MAKVAENSTDYSLNNTVRNMLFLPCTYEEKFSAKQAIDSFFVRMGDVLSAALVFFGTNIMQLSPQMFAAVNAASPPGSLIGAWPPTRRTDALPAAEVRLTSSDVPTSTHAIVRIFRTIASVIPSAAPKPSIAVKLPVVSSSTPVRSGTNLKRTCTSRLPPRR